MPGYYPDSRTAQIPWWATFKTEAHNYAATFPSILTVGNLAKIDSFAALVLNLADAADQAKNYASNLVAYQQIWLSGPLGTVVPAAPVLPALPPIPLGSVVGGEAFARLIVGQLKADPAMTPAIEAAMGISSPSGSLGNPLVQTIQALGGSQVRLRCKKAGYPALQIKMRQNGGAWLTLGVSLSASFTDTTAPLVAGTSEVREYTVQGYLDNIAQGSISAIKSVATTP